MTSDPYVYPGTDVLRNKPGILDGAALARFEAQAVRIRELELRQQPASPPFDLKRLQAIHKHLFQDVYEWAGEIRTVSIWKQGVPFATPAFVATNAEQIFDRLRRERYLIGQQRRQFIDRLAYFLGEVNALHPFREGNGRSQRELFRQLALHAGWRLDFDAMDPDENVAASIEVTIRSHDRLAALLDGLISPRDDSPKS